MRFLLISILCSAATLGAEEFRFDGEAAWSTWKRPHGLVEFGEGGQLRLIKYRKDMGGKSGMKYKVKYFFITMW